MKMIVTYPVIFTETNDNKETVLIDVPDIEGALSEGFGMQDARGMARSLISDMLYDMLEDGEEIPDASDAEDIDVEGGHFFDAGISSVEEITVEIDE